MASSTPRRLVDACDRIGHRGTEGARGRRWFCRIRWAHGVWTAWIPIFCTQHEEVLLRGLIGVLRDRSIPSPGVQAPVLPSGKLRRMELGQVVLAPARGSAPFPGWSMFDLYVGDDLGRDVLRAPFDVGNPASRVRLSAAVSQKEDCSCGQQRIGHFCQGRPGCRLRTFPRDCWRGGGPGESVREDPRQ